MNTSHAHLHLPVTFIAFTIRPIQDTLYIASLNPSLYTIFSFVALFLAIPTFHYLLFPPPLLTNYTNQHTHCSTLAAPYIYLARTHVPAPIDVSRRCGGLRPAAWLPFFLPAACLPACLLSRMHVSGSQTHRHTHTSKIISIVACFLACCSNVYQVGRYSESSRHRYTQADYHIYYFLFISDFLCISSIE